MYMGNTCTMNIIYDYNADNFDHSELDFIGGMQLYSEPGEREPVNSVTDLTTAGRQDLGRGVEGRARPQLGLATPGSTPRARSLPYEDQFLDLDPNYRDRFGNPLLRLTFDWHENEQAMWRFIVRAIDGDHEGDESDAARRDVTPELPEYNIAKYQSTHPTGGCIMGTDPGDSVTNSYGQVWDTPNVFVTGAALFPQNPGANPTGTVGALDVPNGRRDRGAVLAIAERAARLRCGFPPT